MAILDLDHLKRIVGDDPAFLRQVLQIFVTNSPKDMSSLMEAVNSGNLEQVAFYSHKLKSASGAIGYLSAHEDFKLVEAMAKEPAPLDKIKEKVESLSEDCAACMVDIEAIMNSF